jgi:hypothetical protein
MLTSFDATYIFLLLVFLDANIPCLLQPCITNLLPYINPKGAYIVERNEESMLKSCWIWCCTILVLNGILGEWYWDANLLLDTSFCNLVPQQLHGIDYSLFHGCTSRRGLVLRKCAFNGPDMPNSTWKVEMAQIPEIFYFLLASILFAKVAKEWFSSIFFIVILICKLQPSNWCSKSNHR